MWIVAVGRWSTADEREASALATDLGVTAYEARMKLSAVVPSVLLTTNDEARARTIHSALVARKHEAVTFSEEDIVSAERMISLKRFTFDEQGLFANDPDGAFVPWSALSLLVRANHRSLQESTVIKKEKRFDAVRAIASGGLLLRKTTETKSTTQHRDGEQVLYLFRRDSKLPWILRERETHYGALGQVAPTTLANFVATIALIRKKAPSAIYDERLFTRRGSPDDFDLLAHAMVCLAS